MDSPRSLILIVVWMITTRCLIAEPCLNVMDANVEGNVGLFRQFMDGCYSRIFERVKLHEIINGIPKGLKKVPVSLPISTMVIYVSEERKKSAHQSMSMDSNPREAELGDALIIKPDYANEIDVQESPSPGGTKAMTNYLINGLSALLFTSTSQMSFCKKWQLELPLIFGIVTFSTYASDSKESRARRFATEAFWDTVIQGPRYWFQFRVLHSLQYSDLWYLRLVGAISYGVDQAVGTWGWEHFNHWLSPEVQEKRAADLEDYKGKIMVHPIYVMEKVEN